MKSYLGFIETLAPILKAIVVGAIVGSIRPADLESGGSLPEIPAILEERYGIRK